MSALKQVVDSFQETASGIMAEATQAGMYSSYAMGLVTHLLKPGVLTPDAREQVQLESLRYTLKHRPAMCNPQTHADKGEAL